MSKNKFINLKDHDGSVSLSELYSINIVVSELLKDYIKGGSYEGNGRNWNFEFNGKPYLMRIEKDDFHTEQFMKNGHGYWEETDEPKTYYRGLEGSSKDLYQKQLNVLHHTQGEDWEEK
tara:strand:- start:904 stop:1260 length:357 start_codon:yes stop_codon:yes gene_type:complete